MWLVHSAIYTRNDITKTGFTNFCTLLFILPQAVFLLMIRHTQKRRLILILFFGCMLIGLAWSLAHLLGTKELTWPAQKFVCHAFIFIISIIGLFDAENILSQHGLSIWNAFTK